ncbi:MAG: acyl-CoA dehydrogenase family protein [Deltaproteobacteria bacterium]|nr:acyl-CoA dehydrogenase family protein [Deltaproteobacteria bacterium]MBW2417945.1 acyl-CoA dehydrogenase family protein [Deltaproteobacteria bacterium]
MDFNDTPEEAAFRAEARAWLEANADPLEPGEAGGDLLGERVDAAALKAAKAWQKKKADAGWACITWPKEYGGRAATAIQSVIWNQEHAKFRTPANIFSIGIGMCGPTVLAHGTPEQRERWIPDLLSGEKVWCQLFSEPAAGSDLAGLRSTAVRDGDDWIVNGQKIWTTGAHFCDWGIIVVRSDPGAAKHAGLTYFVVDMHAPGVEIRPITQINGGKGFNEVFFTDVRIPDDQRLDAVGNGWRVALTTLMNERASIGGSAGASAIEDLFRLAREIEVGGQPVIEDPAVRQKLADFYVRSAGVKYTGLRTITALSKGTMPGPEASLGKLIGAILGQNMAAYAMELQGVAGGITSDPATTPHQGAWQDRYLGLPGLRIAGGTDEILRNIIAERVLGLPPEARVDKGVAFKDIPSGPPSA